VRVRHRFESFESGAEVLEFSGFEKAAHEGLPLDRDDGLQQANGRLGQQTEGLFRRQKQTLKVGHSGLSGLALDPEGLVAPESFDPCARGFVFDGRWKRISPEGTSFTFGLDEREVFNVERLPSDTDRALEAPICLLCSGEALPEEVVALSRVLVVVPAPEFLDRHVAILGYPGDQRLCRAEGVSELLPYQHYIRDWWPARSR
jgi:hypothetical protein